MICTNKFSALTSSSLLTALFLATPTLAASPFQIYCPDLIAPVEVKSNQKRIEALDERGKSVLARYQALSRMEAELKKLLPLEEALDIVEESDISLFRDRLEALLSHLENGKGPLRPRLIQRAEAALKEDHFLPEQIQARIKEWEEGTLHRWFRLLGDRTEDEALELYIGKTPLAGFRDVKVQAAPEIDPTSLVGKYILETGAATKWIQHPVAPGEPALGPPKLLVAVSAASFPQFSSIAKTPNFMSVLGHANVLHREAIYTYGGAKSEMRLPSTDTPLPLMIMKTSEAERFKRYMDHATGGRYPSWDNALKQPWRLTGYSATGGYSCCTHWLGNVPIGDRRVDSYTFPGRVENNEAPRTQKLQPYVVTDPRDEVLYEVWKTPGHQQLSSVIGQEYGNSQGSFASPGWVIYSLLGPTKNERVPVIFYITIDHQTPIADNYTLRFEHPW